VLTAMLHHQSHRALAHHGINLLRHDDILSTRKDAATNPGRFTMDKATELESTSDFRDTGW
ncbi:MAG: hypothetical protein LKI58_00005, partial [Actinomyces sp.]